METITIWHTDLDDFPMMGLKFGRWCLLGLLQVKQTTTHFTIVTGNTYFINELYKTK